MWCKVITLLEDDLKSYHRTFESSSDFRSLFHATEFMVFTHSSFKLPLFDSNCMILRTYFLSFCVHVDSAIHQSHFTEHCFVIVGIILVTGSFTHIGFSEIL